ncbi:MAG: IS1 family transposase [Vicingaceae bacterium]
MKCKKCTKLTLIKKGKRGIKQRYQCKSCGKYQLDYYTYKLYNVRDDNLIKAFNAEGVGIRSMTRILGYSRNTLIRRILYLASEVKRPYYSENNQVYEIDELWTFVGRNDPSNFSWVTYAINRRTHQVLNISFGSRSKENLRKVVDSVKAFNPKKIITDRLLAYPNLVKPIAHDTTRYSNNHIERGNLTLRTHLKRLSRRTICFSRSQKMLEACILLYLDQHNWRLKMS